MYLGYAWRPDNFKKGTINRLLRQGNYDFMGQNDPYFPDRSSLYFDDKYWHKKDDLQALKKMYYLLKHNGIEVEDEITTRSLFYLFGGICKNAHFGMKHPIKHKINYRNF